MENTLPILLVFSLISACSNDKSGFSGSASKPAADAKPVASPTPTSTPDLKAGVLSFVKTPDASTTNKTAYFQVAGDRPVKTYYFSLDGSDFTSTQDDHKSMDVFVGNHTLFAKADFVDGTKSELISYKWLYHGVMDWVPKGVTAYDATVFGGSWILTPALGNTQGMLITTYRYLLKSFNVNFVFRIDGGKNCYYQKAGDGLAFGFTPKKIADLAPQNGSGIGFVGTGGSGVKFDTYQNTESNEPSDNFTALLVDGVVSVAPPVTTNIPTFADGADHKVEIAFDSGAISVTIDTKLVFSKVSLPNWKDGQDGHLFFSASTGGACSRHVLKSFDVSYLDASGSD